MWLKLYERATSSGQTYTVCKIAFPIDFLICTLSNICQKHGFSWIYILEWDLCWPTHHGHFLSLTDTGRTTARRVVYQYAWGTSCRFRLLAANWIALFACGRAIHGTTRRTRTLPWCLVRPRSAGRRSPDVERHIPLEGAASGGGRACTDEPSVMSTVYWGRELFHVNVPTLTWDLRLF